MKEVYRSNLFFVGRSPRTGDFHGDCLQSEFASYLKFNFEEEVVMLCSMQIFKMIRCWSLIWSCNTWHQLLHLMA